MEPQAGQTAPPTNMGMDTEMNDTSSGDTQPNYLHGYTLYTTAQSPVNKAKSTNNPDEPRTAEGGEDCNNEEAEDNEFDYPWFTTALEKINEHWNEK